jgi:adenosylmethionine-8-amino-7-oxononanoate aminotransferase
MTGFVVVGTDTDAGKTWFCTEWLKAHSSEYAYWKPVETGDSDTAKVRAAVPGATIFEPLMRFEEAVAPTLAAERAGKSLPTIAEVIAAIPNSEKPIVLETFGSAMSPFGPGVLQAELLAELGWPIVLVSQSTVGAIGRTLQACAGLREYGLQPAMIVLMGERDEYAEREIAAFTGREVLDGFAASMRADIPSGLHDRREHNTLIERDRSAVWHPYTPLVGAGSPVEVLGATAEFLELADGRRIIDGISSWWTIQHGHRHPPLMAALRRASTRIDHVIFAGFTHEYAVETAELLLQSSPWPGGKVFYSDNGSTAVEVALKMAYQAWCHRGEPRRTLFVGFENGYHGDTFGAMAAGRDPLFFSRFDPLLFRTLRVPVSASALAETLDRHSGEVAAVILEPLLQAAGGMVMHTPEELKAIFGVCRERGVYFIADEVMTGGGRTGTFWASERAGIAPDFLCAGKTLTGGTMPLAATIIAPHVVEHFQTPDRAKTFFHGHSFTAHPVACAVAAENLRIMRTGEWKKQVERIEDFWRQSLGDLPGVRILGSVVAVDVPVAGGYLAGVGAMMERTVLEEGVLLRPLGNVLYAMPPYGTSQKSLEKIASAMRKALNTGGSML